MKICMPVDQINGLESEIFPNFRGAPSLLVIDSDSCECVGIDAANGACSATPVLIDAIVCSGGIGRGMFNGLRSRGIRVFNTDAFTVAEALTELAEGRLEEVRRAVQDYGFDPDCIHAIGMLDEIQSGLQAEPAPEGAAYVARYRVKHRPAMV